MIMMGRAEKTCPAHHLEAEQAVVARSLFDALLNVNCLFVCATEIVLAERGVFGHLFGNPVKTHASAVQQIPIITTLQRKLNILFNQKNGNPRLREIEDDPEDLMDDHWSETKRGLIQHQQLRFSHQSAADGQHLLLPT